MRGKEGIEFVCPKPPREGGGDMGFCWGEWNPKTCREASSFSVNSGESERMASQNRCARAIRRAFGGGRVVEGFTDAGDMIGVSGGVGSPIDGFIVACEALEIETVAMT